MPRNRANQDLLSGRAGAQYQDLSIIIFVHGWKHNDAPSDTMSLRFAAFRSRWPKWNYSADLLAGAQGGGDLYRVARAFIRRREIGRPDYTLKRMNSPVPMPKIVSRFPG